MKLVALVVFTIVIFDVSYGLKCKEDSRCKSETEMGYGHYSTFKNQPNAPCWSVSYYANTMYADYRYCYTSTEEPLTAMKCKCWDETKTYDNKWCNEGFYGKNNTMCFYQKGPVAACGESPGDVKVLGIEDQAVKDAIVDKHNNLRSRVARGEENKGVGGGQPKAANMRKLVWNNELAKVAQRWVNQCIDGHDGNRQIEKFDYVGQNWARINGVGSLERQAELATAMVGGWYDEVKDITRKAVKSFETNNVETGSKGVIGHYTQVVWATTYEVGCGYISNGKGPYIHSVLVCNYGPGGNFPGRPVYKEGTPGSRCPSGTTKTTDGLCA